jgi:hypothetical protein
LCNNFIILYVIESQALFLPLKVHPLIVPLMRVLPMLQKGKRLAPKVLDLVSLQSPVVLAVSQNRELLYWSQEIDPLSTGHRLGIFPAVWVEQGRV